MITSSPPGAALAGLAERFGDRISFDVADRDRFRSDYGRLVDRQPGAVARCRNTQEVAEVVRYCAEHQLPIAVRAQGHTQSGQSTTDGGVLLDTSSMQTIHEIDADGLAATCDCGVVWRDLVRTTVPLGLVPRVLTNNLGVTICGTLSVAGLGVASYRFGAQVDNVLEIEVVTGTGEVVVCSPQANRELFDLVRSGFGQFGVMTRAKVRLRAAKPHVRKYYLLYDDLGTLMKDSELVMAKDDQTFHTLESWCSPCLQGARKIGEGMELGVGAQLFAYWMYPFHLTIEYGPGEEPDDDAVLSKLHFYKKVEVCDYDQLDFCERLQPIFQLWDRSGYSGMAHPWMETILPWETAKDYIELVLSNLPPQTLGPGGHILLWPSRGDTSEAPNFMTPPGEFVMGWGILPGVPHQYLEQALEKLDMASELSIGYGGKRYLSGYVTFDTPEKWQAHFGERWPALVAAKRQYDPAGILNPGFIRWE